MFHFLSPQPLFVALCHCHTTFHTSNQIVRVIEQPGIQVKLPAPFESIRFFDRRILTIDTPEAERFITSEKKNLLVDSYV